MKTYLLYSNLIVALIASCGPLLHKEKAPERESIASNLIVKPDAGAEKRPAAAAQENSTLIFAESDAHNVAISASRASDSVTAEITLKKSSILGRTFLYGFDLQYSSAKNSDLSLIDQSMALGHIPVNFAILGDKLQVLTDSRRLFESAVNHPETLVNEYRILNQKEDTLTIALEKPGLLLHKTVNGSDAPALADSWLRSITFIENGNYILQESAIMLADGRVQTYLESIFPRDSLVPAGYKGIEDNRDVNPDSARFMFINNEKVFVERKIVNGVPVREETTFANRFNLASSTSTIDWYVTPNMPDEFMKEMKSGIEGWNRYFHDQQGRDVVRFLGRLPDGVKLGDPRYNVVNFDTVAKAGAAYETQASDPTTGIQSHSMIYMPYAWYNIAAGLIDARELPIANKSSIGPKAPEVLFGSSREIVRCARDAQEVSTSVISEMLASASSDSEAARIVDDFGRKVFISTLFHEMGHAFGLGHNFKGSLTYDGSKPVDFATNPTTNSTMDYNYYQHEVDLMDAIGSTNGPRLEYDRQAISMLYNKGADIKPTDKEVPACNDEDADDVTGGVDPDCIRYDAENNPIIGLEHALGRLTDATGAKGIESRTLSQALEIQKTQIVSRLSDASTMKDAKAVRLFIAERSKALGKLFGYYYSKGAQSLATNLKLNAGSLRQWSSNPEDDGITMTEADRRKRYAAIVLKSVQMTTLPDAPKLALKNLQDSVAASINSSAQLGSAEVRASLAKDMVQLIDSTTTSSVANNLAALRTAAATALILGKDKAKFASIVIDGKIAEQLAFDTLRGIATNSLSVSSLGSMEVQKSRMAGVVALNTFAALGDDYALELSALKAELVSIRNSAHAQGKQDVVDHVRDLLKKL